LLKTSLYSEVPWLNALLAKYRLVRQIDLLIERANVDMTPGLFLLCSVAAAGLTIFLTSLLGQPAVAILVFGVVALLCPYMYLKFITWKRLRKFLEQLPKLADIIRDRFRIERLIKSLTAQNRMSAWTVCSIPPILAVFMFVREPEIMNNMMTDPIGRGLLATAVVLELIGILVFRKV